MFDERRAAQAAAFFLFRNGGKMPLLKLMKLIYLAERLSFQKYGEPLTGDRLVSMDHGPVLSRVYDHMNGAVRSTDGGWESYIADRAGHFVALCPAARISSPEDDLLELSESDLAVLEEIWAEFGHLDRWELVRYTHRNLPEWDDPHGTSLPISHDRLFKALGYSNDQSKLLQSRLAEQDGLASAFHH